MNKDELQSDHDIITIEVREPVLIEPRVTTPSEEVITFFCLRNEPRGFRHGKQRCEKSSLLGNATARSHNKKFPTKRLALGSVDEDSFGEIAHHRMQLPEETLCLKSRAEGVRMPLVWQTPTLPVHFTCILATVHQQIPKEPLCFEEPERVHRHVAHKGGCIRSPGEIPSIVGILQQERNTDFAMGCCNTSPRDSLYALGENSADTSQDVTLKNRSCM